MEFVCSLYYVTFKFFYNPNICQLQLFVIFNAGKKGIIVMVAVWCIKMSGKLVLLVVLL